MVLLTYPLIYSFLHEIVILTNIVRFFTCVTLAQVNVTYVCKTHLLIPCVKGERSLHIHVHANVAHVKFFIIFVKSPCPHE